MNDVTPAALRAASALLGWNNGTLAERTGLSRNTVQALLAREELSGTVRTLRSIVQVFTDAGIEFIRDEKTGAVGVLRRPTAA